MAQGQSTYTFLDTPLLAAGSFILGVNDGLQIVNLSNP
jgi:hypothetical protein